MIAILDYGAGNLTSVAHAVRHLGWEPTITCDPSVVRRADRVVFPGVGAAGAAMANLERLGLDEALRDVAARGSPLLGICIGCQVLFETSDEDGGTACLGLLRGRVKRFEFAPGVGRKIPHMGWNEVRLRKEHPALGSVEPGSQLYFVHSYYVVPDDPDVVLGTTTYGGIEFPAIVGRGSLLAVQFHAEKSGAVGLGIIDGFLRWTGT